MLEICSKELSEGSKIYEMMYTIDGEILEQIDDLEDDIQLILVSEDAYSFKGIYNPKEGLDNKQLRMVNA